jgi:hypothetical protein
MKINSSLSIPGFNMASGAPESKIYPCGKYLALIDDDINCQVIPSFLKKGLPPTPCKYQLPFFLNVVTASPSSFQ